MSRLVPRGGLGPEWPNEPDDGQAWGDQGAQRNGAPGQDRQQRHYRQGRDQHPTRRFDYQGRAPYPGNGDPRGRAGSGGYPGGPRGLQDGHGPRGTRQYEDRYDAFTGILKSRAAVIDVDLAIGVAGSPSRLHEHVDERAVPIVP